MTGDGEAKVFCEPRRASPTLWLEGFRAKNVKPVGNKVRRAQPLNKAGSYNDLNGLMQIPPNPPFSKGGITAPAYEALTLRSFASLRMTKKPFFSSLTGSCFQPGRCESPPVRPGTGGHRRRCGCGRSGRRAKPPRPGPPGCRHPVLRRRGGPGYGR